MAMTDAAKYMEFESREDTYNQLLYRLEKDDGSVMLGVYGTPGFGKTTLIEQVSKRAMELQLFDQVALVSASQILDARALRLKIGKCLDVEFPEEEEEEAAELAKKWASGANVLVILDDVENKIPNLEDVGIPFGDNKWGNAKIIDNGEGDEPVKGCKIIITSQTKDICYINECKELFEIERLDKDEAIDMISEVVGISTIDSLQDKQLPGLMCYYCQNLPLKIAVLGKALQGKGDDEWWWDIIDQMTRYGRDPLDVSLDALPKDAKLCLLACSVYDGAGDSMIPVDFLFRTAMVLGLFQGLETLADARYKLDSMVAILKSSFLLVEGTYNHVKMHNLVRDEVRVIAKDQEYGFHFEASESMLAYHFALESKRPLEIRGNITDIWGIVKLLSLTFETKDIFEFPEGEDFQNLHTLIINFNDLLDKIKDDFFNVFVNLRHLMLSSTPVLPSSLCNLEANLRTLSISNCKLDDISIITRMKNLEMLSFERVDFSTTPAINLKEMQELRLLHFTNCHGVTLLQHSISSLSKLEELIITDGFRISNEEDWDIPVYSELCKLTRLTSLHIYFRLDTASFQDEIFWQNLRRYTISFGQDFQNGELISSSKSLKFYSTDLQGDGMVSLVQRSQELVLLWVPSGLRHCFRIKNGKEFAQVTRLKLGACSTGKYLGKLVQWRLNKVALHSFFRLRVLDLSICPELEYLFSTPVARGLEQLQELKIFDCENLEEIVYDQTEEECQEIITFPKLTSIEFCNLNSFKSFRSRAIITAAAQADLSLFDEMVKFPALKSIKINGVAWVRSVFDGKVDFPSLKVLDIIQIYYLKEIWKMDSEGNSFGQLEILKVKTCNELEKLIPSGMLLRLKYLREPKVEDCKLLLPMLSEDEHEEPSSVIVEDKEPSSVVVEDEEPSSIVVEDEELSSVVVEDEDEEPSSVVVEDEELSSAIVEDEEPSGIVVEDEEPSSVVVEDEELSIAVVEDEDEEPCSVVVEDEELSSAVVEDEEPSSVVVENEEPGSVVVEEEELSIAVVEDEDEEPSSVVVEDEELSSAVVEDEDEDEEPSSVVVGDEEPSSAVVVDL